jgi:hypothetical protein
MGVPGEHCVLAMPPGSGGLDALSVHPSAGAAEPSGLTHETCIHVPARAECAPTLSPISAASAHPVMPRRPIAYLLKRAEF